MTQFLKLFSKLQTQRGKTSLSVSFTYNGSDPPFLLHPAMLTGLHYQWLISFEDVTRGEHDLISTAHMHTPAHSDTIKGKRLLTWCSVRRPTVYTVPAVYFPLTGEDAAATCKKIKGTQFIPV